MTSEPAPEPAHAFGGFIGPRTLVGFVRTAAPYLFDGSHPRVGELPEVPDDGARLHALAFHPLEYDIVARPSYVAQRGAAPFLDAISTAFAPGGPKLTLLVGHDTNIAHLGGALDLHWKAADYPANDPPPGGALGFELLRDAHGRRFVRAFFTAQSMDQLRNLDTLSLKSRPFRQVVAIPGCGTAARNFLCPLADFQTLVASKRPAA